MPPAGAPFEHDLSAPILTLTFNDLPIQARALARLATFYESDTHASAYVPLTESAKLCKYYEGYNFPLRIVPAWLDCMAEAVPALDRSAERWWEPECNAEENALLALLQERELLDAAVAAPADAEVAASEAGYYLISHTRKLKGTLPHEKLHALYYLSSSYRDAVSTVWADLPRNIRPVVEYDLKMRGYVERIWADEFQAYASLNSAEFGKKCKPACEMARRALVEAQKKAWREMEKPGP